MELADDEEEDVVDGLGDDPAERGQAQSMVIPPTQRRRCRSWASRWVQAVTAVHAVQRPPIFLRMAVTRLYLNLLAAGVWGTDDDWRAELNTLVRTLIPTDQEEADSPGQEISYLSSLTAVCLALLLQDASLHGGREHDLTANAAWTSAHHLAAFAEPGMIAEYLHQPKQAHARVATESEVEHVVDLAQDLADDPHAAIRAAFKREGLEVEQHDGVWVVDGDFRIPRRAAAKVATLIGSDCVVLARNTRSASIVLRAHNTLVVAESATPRWRIYQLTPLSTPQSILARDDGLPTTRNNHPLEPIPPIVRDIAAQADANPEHLVVALRTAALRTVR